MGPRQLDLGVAHVNTQVSWIKPRCRRWNFRMASWQARNISQLQSEALTYHQLQGLSQLATRDSHRQQDVLRAYIHATSLPKQPWYCSSLRHLPPYLEKRRGRVGGFFNWFWLVHLRIPSKALCDLSVSVYRKHELVSHLGLAEGAAPTSCTAWEEARPLHQEIQVQQKGTSDCIPALINWAAWLKQLKGGRGK